MYAPVYRNGAAPAARVATAAPAPAPVAHVEPRAAEPKAAHAEPRKETYKLVKGPDAVGVTPKKGAPAKVAKADDDEDEKPAAKTPAKVEKAKPGKTARVEIEQKADKGKKVAAKTDDDEDEKPAAKAPAKVEKAKPAAQPQKKAEAAQPAQREARVEQKSVQVDPQPTASLPPKAEEEKSADSANPEFRWPARGRVIQGFKTGGNDGINIAVPEGTAVKAAEGGVVKYAGSELKGYGNLVLIQHPNGFVSAYAHNGELDVKRGDTVKRGQTIAKAGQTGNVTTPQVHFELRKGATPVDPTGYLAGL